MELSPADTERRTNSVGSRGQPYSIWDDDGAGWLSILTACQTDILSPHLP